MTDKETTQPKHAPVDQSEDQSTPRTWTTKKRVLVLGGLAAFLVLAGITSAVLVSGSQTRSESEAVSDGVSQESTSTKAAAAVPAEYTKALSAAEDFQRGEVPFSKARLYNVLVGTYSAEAAQYAVDNKMFDYKATAAKLAKLYIVRFEKTQDEAKAQLLVDLFTPEEAQYGVDNYSR